MDAKSIISSSVKKIDVIEFDLIDSTNAEAKRMASTLYDNGDSTPRLILAKEQTAGRGRMGRSFFSKASHGIFMSLLYFTDKPLADVVSVTTATAAIVAAAIEKFTQKSMRIKWVNDIYNDKGKVCGILTETVPFDKNTVAVVVGIGINIGDGSFPPELQNIAASIGDVSGKEDDLIAEIVDGILMHADHPNDNTYMTEYRKRFMLMGADVILFQNGEAVNRGKVLGVDDRGGLLFVPDGSSETLTVHSGEVSVRVDGSCTDGLS